MFFAIKQSLVRDCFLFIMRHDIMFAETLTNTNIIGDSMFLGEKIEGLLNQRYYKAGEDWPALVERVVSSVCEDENDHYQKQMYDSLLYRIFLPNSPCLANAGTKNSGLLACFVVGPDEDTLEHHVDVLGDVAAVGKRGGGCGFTGTNIRAYNQPIAGSAHGYAYGPNNWAMRVSEYLDMISQNGFRRMALMYSLPSEHPDLDDFIDLKQHDEKYGYNFNQSVFASDEWLRNGQKEGTKERNQFLRLVRNAWNNGEPGLLFADTINEHTPYKTCGCPILTANPCSEQVLPSYGACCLGSISLGHDYFFMDGKFSWELLEHITRLATRFLDDVGSKNIFPNDKFKNWYEKHRPIGIGVMGLADALLRMGLAYGEKESINFIEKIMRTIQFAADKESVSLGKERGVPEHCSAVGRRNITLVSIAPTGSIAMIAGCTGHSIEPIFSPKYNRTDERGATYKFEHELADKPFFRSTLNTDKNKIPSWKQHLDIQIAAQKWTDSAISKTINMLNGVSENDIEDAFIYAWKHGCKGITIYRDGSRNIQVLDDITEDDANLQECPTGVCLI